MPIDPSLLAILACPKCKGPLVETPAPEGFGCRACALLFKTEDGIPDFLIEEAISWNGSL